MSDLCREFELQIWEKSLCFNIEKGKSITTNHTVIGNDFITNKGDEAYAIMGRTIERTSTSQE